MKKLSNISESIWSDIQDRSNGNVFRKEDEQIIAVIKEFVERHNLKEGEYTINSDFSLDVYKSVFIKPNDLIDKMIPFKFGKVDGVFNIVDLKLETLKNSPREVTKDFVAYENNIQNFIGGPEIVGGNFAANVNYSLVSLDGSPKKIGGNYSILGCSWVKDIKGISPEIGKNLEIPIRPRVEFSDDDYRKYSNIKGQIIRK